MGELEHAWAAGFFDGEGCLSVTRRRRGDRIDKWITMQVAQSDRRPLERLARVFGGRIIPVGPNALSRKPRWQWYLSNRAEIFAAMGAMLPYLSEPTVEAWKAVREECPPKIRRNRHLV